MVGNTVANRAGRMAVWRFKSSVFRQPKGSRLKVTLISKHGWFKQMDIYDPLPTIRVAFSKPFNFLDEPTDITAQAHEIAYYRRQGATNVYEEIR